MTSRHSVGQAGASATRRLGARILLLPLIWAVCVFIIAQLFSDVSEFDGARPRATPSDAMRQVRQEMVGEPLNDDGSVTSHSLPTGGAKSAKACLVPLVAPGRSADTAPVHGTAVSQQRDWESRLEGSVRRATNLMQSLKATWALGQILREAADGNPGTEGAIYSGSTSIRTGSLIAGATVLREGGTINVAGSVERDAEITMIESGGVVVAGSLDGGIAMRDGAVYVGRDLTGTLRADASVVLLVDGDLTGDVALGDSSTVFVRGRVTGKLRVARRARCQVFLAHEPERAALEAMMGDYERCVLNVPRLAGFQEGTHDVRIGSWRRVVVGNECWERVR